MQPGARRPLDPRLVAAVAVGGALGACLRWAVTQAVPVDPETFPWTTFAVNVSGSLLLALLPASASVRRHRVLPPFLGTGVLGGYTTLSATSEEGRALVAAGHTGLAAAYLLGTLAACLAAVALADRLTTRSARAELEVREGDL